MQGAKLGGYAIKIDFGMANSSTGAAPLPYNNTNTNTNTNSNYINTEERPSSRSLYIALPHELNPSEHELFKEFSKYSRVESVKCAPEQHYAFINFESYDGARLALDILFCTIIMNNVS